MKIQEFEKELQAIHKDLAIRPNVAVMNQKAMELCPEAAKLASITFQGNPVCTIPDLDIFNEVNGNYGVDLRNDGRFKAHRTRPEALLIVKDTLNRLANDTEYKEAFLGIGECSNEALAKESNTPELIDDVEVKVKEVKG